MNWKSIKWFFGFGRGKYWESVIPFLDSPLRLGTIESLPPHLIVYGRRNNGEVSLYWGIWRWTLEAKQQFLDKIGDHFCPRPICGRAIFNIGNPDHPLQGDCIQIECNAIDVCGPDALYDFEVDLYGIKPPLDLVECPRGGKELQDVTNYIWRKAKGERPNVK